MKNEEIKGNVVETDINKVIETDVKGGKKEVKRVRKYEGNITKSE